jgi:two-component system, LytTR family, response regulator
MKTVIIDDEDLAREILVSYLKESTDVEIIAQCSNGFEGVKIINELQPDLVFLDVQMPKIDGFEMLELLDNPPLIIFATAFNEFAIKAFELSAVDYLMKPFDKSRLFAALDKARQRLEAGQKSMPGITNLIDTVHDNKSLLDRIVVKNGPKIHVIPVSSIKFLEAQDDYVMIYTDDKKHLKQSTMGYFESHLDPAHFVRVHRSYIVHIGNISQLELYGKESYLLVLKDGNKLPVSRSGYSKLKHALNF